MDISFSLRGKRNTFRPTAWLCCGLVLLLICPGCSTTYPVRPEPAEIKRNIQAGDRLQIVTHSGRQYDMTVTGFSEDAIRGETETIRLADIRDIERKEYSPGKTTAAVVAMGVVVGIVLITALVHSLGGEWDF